MDVFPLFVLFLSVVVLAIAIGIAMRVVLPMWVLPWLNVGYERWIATAPTMWHWVDRFPVSSIVLTPERTSWFQQLIDSAGKAMPWNPRRIMVAKEVGTGVVSIVGLVWLLISFDLLGCLLWVVMMFVAWSWPELYLRQETVRRRLDGVKALGSCLEMLRLHVESGLTIESSLRDVGRTRTDVWGVELRRVGQLLDLGVSFDEAMDRLSTRFDADDVRRFTTALKQAKQLGVSIRDALSIQSDMLRTRRRQRAEEQARVASVKIAIPLVFCIFPALLIVYLAPAVLNVIHSF